MQTWANVSRLTHYKKSIDKIGYLDESIISYQEWDTNIMLSKYCKYFWVNDFLFNYNLNETGSDFRDNKKSINGFLQITIKNVNEILLLSRKKVYSNQIYITICDAIFHNQIELAKSIYNNNKNKLIFKHYFSYNLIQKLKLDKDTFDLLVFIKKSPINGLKHIIKTLFKKLK